MAAPPLVMGDRIMGPCPPGIHLIPFSAPITVGTVATVLIGGKPAAVVGSSGLNVPPHVGLHPSDPHLAPPLQKGQVVSGSATVLIGGTPAATAASVCTCCLTPGTAVPTVTTVLVG
jgi:uncharacterized Zn-binding protein involved in type VI secretion